MTYTRVTGLGFGSRFCAHPFGLLMVKLQMLQALGQCQFLLDSHTKQRVQSLLLIFSCCKLALHFIQLCDILVTSAMKYQEFLATLFPSVTHESFVPSGHNQRWIQRGFVIGCAHFYIGTSAKLLWSLISFLCVVPVSAQVCPLPLLNYSIQTSPSMVCREP